MSNFFPATPLLGFLIPVPSGWIFTDKGNECLIEDSEGNAVKFKLESIPAFPGIPSILARDRLAPYCIRWEIKDKNEYDKNYKVIGFKKVRKGYRRVTSRVLEWLINQK